MGTVYILLVLLFMTRTFGEVAVRLGQPALVGEMLSGIGIADLGIFLLMLPALLTALIRVGDRLISLFGGDQHGYSHHADYTHQTALNAARFRFDRRKE